MGSAVARIATTVGGSSAMASQLPPDGTSENRHALVAAGYDKIGGEYAMHSVSGRTDETYYRQFLDDCLHRIPDDGLVLDAGCGAGIVAADIAMRARVIGVDISATQIRLARERVPGGAFLLADLAELQFKPASFDAIAAFWSMIHVRRELHRRIIGWMHTWLRPGGVLFGTFGSDDNPDERDDDFFGATMYWSHFDAETTLRFMSDARFSIVQADVVEDQGEHPLWVIATT
jgi:SAM-dependent methyltransferase